MQPGFAVDIEEVGPAKAGVRNRVDFIRTQAASSPVAA